MHIGFGGKDVGERIILKWIGWGGTDWIHMVQVRDHWRALVSTKVNLWVP
jgi:hypothetical protein